MGKMQMSILELMKELQNAEGILKPQGSINMAKGQASPPKFKPKGKNSKGGKPHHEHKKKAGKQQKRNGGAPEGRCFKYGDKGHWKRDCPKMDTKPDGVQSRARWEAYPKVLGPVKRSLFMFSFIICWGLST